MGALEGCGSGGTTAPVPSATLDAQSTTVEETIGDETESRIATTTATQQTLRIAFGNVALQFDPAVTIANAGIQAITLIYEGLVRIDADLTVQPALAERWEATEDLLTWTFTLRQDVLFHHGIPFTARDVVYTFERLLDPTLGSSLYSVLSMIELERPNKLGSLCQRRL